MNRLLTPKDVSNLLQISLNTVYDNQKRLGGFYPAGIKVLRFREEVIRELMEGQSQRNLEVYVPGPREGLWRGGIPDEGGSQDGPGREEARRALMLDLHIDGINLDPNRHGIIGSHKRLLGRKSSKARAKNV